MSAELRISRRRAIAGAAAAGLVAWVAPTIESVSAAGACGTPGCTPTTASWSGLPSAEGKNITAAAFTLNGISVTATRSNDNAITNAPAPYGSITTGVIATLGVFGNLSPYVPLCRIGNRVPAPVSMTFTFSTAVSLLSFTIGDIDSDPSASVAYQEEAVISWTAGAGSPVPSYTYLNGNPATCGGGGAGTGTAGLTATGTNSFKSSCPNYNAASNSTLNNLGVAFNGCGTVKTLTITVNDLNTIVGSSNTFGRATALSSFKFCVP